MKIQAALVSLVALAALSLLPLHALELRGDRSERGLPQADRAGDPPAHHHRHQEGARAEHGHPPHGGSTDGMRHDFGDAELWSSRFDDPSRDGWQRPVHVVQMMEIEPGMRVADLGAGTGYFLPYLALAVGFEGRVLALDPEAELVRFMKERCERERLINVEPRIVPYDDPQLAPASVDRILVVNTWHHISDRVAYGRKLLAALRPGGRVYVVDFDLDAPEGPPREHRMTPKEVAKELDAAGFAAVHFPDDLPRQYIVVGRATS